MENVNSLPQENFDRAGQFQLSESTQNLLNWTAQDNQTFRAAAQGTQTGDLTLTNNLQSAQSDQQKTEVERVGHHNHVGEAIVGGIIGGVAAELLFGHHRHDHYYDRYHRPYPPYGYPQQYPPYYPQPRYYPVPVPVPGWGHGGHYHGGGHHHGGGHRHRW